MTNTDLGRVFTDGAQFVDFDGRRHYRAAVIPAGFLELRSGQVAVADALVPEAAVTLPVTATAGRWPTELCAMTPIGGDNGSEAGLRVIGARVRFAEAKAVRWEMAMTDREGQPVGPYPQYPRISPGGLNINCPTVAVFDRSRLDGPRDDGNTLILAARPRDLVYP